MSNNYTRTFRRLAIWPTLPPDLHYRKASSRLPFPLDQENCRIFSRARHALWQACQAVGLGDGDVILVPAYHHGSEVEALIQAGLQVRYYEVNPCLEPDAEALDGLLDEQVKALYLIHYLGFPQDAAYWRRWCDERNILLIEDAAQAFLASRDGQPVGSFGHVAIFCLYKTYGIPDGGAVICSPPPVPAAMRPPSGYWRMLKRHANWLASRWGGIGVLHLLVKPTVAWFKRIGERPHAEFELGNPATPPTLVTNNLVRKVIDATTAEQRRSNYRFLLEHLRDMVPPAFATLPEGASPFAFPLQVEHAREFLQKLHKRGVLGLLFWINPHPSLPVDDFPLSKQLREGVLAVPVHQELTTENLIMIVDAVKACGFKEDINKVASPVA
jgi:dTDP-4-amino-4,6-dideoxygalactose transaminase